MKKILLSFFILSSLLFANNQIIEDENIVMVKISNTNFEKSFLNLKDELTFKGFTIVYELDIAKATNYVANILGKNSVLKKGTNIGICKTTFTLEMIEEYFHNINYCPLGFSIYQTKNDTTYISYKKYKAFGENEHIASKINQTMKNLIINSLE